MTTSASTTLHPQPAQRPRRPSRRAQDRRHAEHVLAAIQATAWAITEEALQTILAVAHRETDVEALEARLGRELDNTYAVTVRDGVATIPVRGPLLRYGNIFARISGATSYDVLATDFTTALENPQVRAILLDVDSPGGATNGLSALAGLIAAARGQKPVVAYISGLGASAAYWLASAAEEVVANDTAVVGSIGAVLTITDTRERDAKSGVRSATIVSSQSPKKHLDPIDDPEGRAEARALVDALADVFVDTVAANRGVSRDVVLADFGQGGVFVGARAVSAGLADRLGTYEQVHAELVARTAHGSAPYTPARPAPRAGASRPGATAAAGHSGAVPSTSTEDHPMTRPEQPGAVAPETAPEAAEADGTANQPFAAAAPAAAPATAPAATADTPDVAAQLAAARTEGAATERARIAAIEAIATPGHEALVAAAKADPTATAESLALQMVATDRAARGRQLAAMQGDEAALAASGTPSPVRDGTTDPASPAAESQRILATLAAVTGSASGTTIRR